MSLSALALVVLASTSVHRSAVIVGVNDPFDQSQAKLQYADDDAARYFEMLTPHVDHIELLTVLDEESQELYPEAAKISHLPTSDELDAALGRAFREGRTARESGRRAELYFVYVGHGRIVGGEGQVKLVDGDLNRSQLTERVLSVRAHDRTHLIIDACNAYHLVNARGADTKSVSMAFEADFEKFVEEQSLDRFPTLGVVLSTSGVGATHEWSRYQGGVFSHEIRSALAGSADANRDGAVDYTELEAFVAAANLNVPALKGRPKIFVRPPKIESKASLLKMSEQLPQLLLPQELGGHYYVEDDRGLRYAELNKATGFQVALHLVPRRSYHVLNRKGDTLATFDNPEGRLEVPWPVTPTPSTRAPRGTEEPPGIFQTPYGPKFLTGFSARDLVTEAPPPESGGLRAYPTIGFASAGLAAVATTFAVVSGVQAGNHYDTYRMSFDDATVDGAEADFRGARNRAIAFSITAGVAAAVSVTMFIMDALDDD